MKKVFFSLLAFFSGIVHALAQCPMCKTAVESNLKNDGASVGLGLNDGILYLLAAPYFLVLVVGLIWYRNYRIKKSQNPS
jgi:hypothetical protein